MRRIFVQGFFITSEMLKRDRRKKSSNFARSSFNTRIFASFLRPSNILLWFLVAASLALPLLLPLPSLSLLCGTAWLPLLLLSNEETFLLSKTFFKTPDKRNLIFLSLFPRFLSENSIYKSNIKFCSVYKGCFSVLRKCGLYLLTLEIT